KNKTLKSTSVSMEQYLHNHGYYDAHVEYKIDTLRRKKEAQVNWHINPEKLYLIDSISITSEDSIIHKLIDNDWRNQVIHPGMPISINNYNAERDRVVQLLRNKGYPNFSISYIDKFTVDTTGGHNNVELEVLTPSDRKTHPRFKNRNVFIYKEGTNEMEYIDSLEKYKNTPGIHFFGENFKVR